MSETPSLSADERAGPKRLRSEEATLRSQVQAGGAKLTRPRAAVGGRQRWRTIVATQPATGPRPLSGPVGPRRPHGNRLTAPCPLTDGGIEALT